MCEPAYNYFNVNVLNRRILETYSNSIEACTDKITEKYLDSQRFQPSLKYDCATVLVRFGCIAL